MRKNIDLKVKQYLKCETITNGHMISKVYEKKLVNVCENLEKIFNNMVG